MVLDMGNAEHSFEILSLKKFRKVEARIGKDSVLGSEGGDLRLRREFKVDQS